MRTIQLTDYEYMMCVLFSEESARSQQKIEFGNKATAKDLTGKSVKTLYAERWQRLRS